MTREAQHPSPSTSSDPGHRRDTTQPPACFTCGAPARWRIVIAGEDEPRTEEDACEDHARGHQRLKPIAT